MAKGHVRQRGDNLEVRVYAGGGRTVTKTVRWQGSKKATKDAADRQLRELLDEYDGGGRTGHDATVAQLIARWRKHAEADWSPTTRDARESYLRLHILPALGDKKVRNVRTADIDDFYAALRAKGLAPSTIRRSVHVILRTAFGEAVRWRWITVNPAAEASPPKRGLDQIDLHPPTQEQVRALLDLARVRNPDLYAFLAVAADTGARRGEVCALRWSKVDLAAGELLIDRAIVLDGKQRVEKDTKSHQARRIALGAPCVAILREHRQHVLERAMAVGARVRPDGYLFSEVRDFTGERPWRPDGATARFMKLREQFCDCLDDRWRLGPRGCKDAAHQAMRRIRLHDLRHALVTDWLAGGEDPRTVMGRVGHSSLQILSRYAHFVPAKDREAADRRGDRLAT